MSFIHYDDWVGCMSLVAQRAMREHYERHSTHPLASPESADLVWSRIERGVLQACLIDGYLLVYEIGPTWCSLKPLLHELLLIKTAPSASFDEAVAGMVELARAKGCVGVMTGNGVLRPGLRRLYMRRGFRAFNEAYFMEV